MPPFITQSQVMGYLEGATSDAMDFYLNNGSIHFNTEVTWISFDDETNLFEVEVIDFNDQSEEKIGTYDKVILAVGQHTSHYSPEDIIAKLNATDGQSPKFNKPAIHSSEIHSLGENIVGKKFLFIGAAYSAEDLALSFIKRGAEHIYITSNSEVAFPVDSVASWPMEKVTLLHRTEIKEVLGHNKLRMGRMDLTTTLEQRIAEKYYNRKHENFVLEDIDAIIFCTGYTYDFNVMLSQNLLPSSPSYYDGETNYYIDNGWINTEMENDRDWEGWENLYNRSVFDPENGFPLPSETDFHSCGNPIHANHGGDLWVDPSRKVLGTYNHQLISNPGIFFFIDQSEEPLANIDISAALIVKSITGDVPTPATKAERFERRIADMLGWIRHSRVSRSHLDNTFYEALTESSMEAEKENHPPYSLLYHYFRMFLMAKEAGHSAGSFIVEVTESNNETPNYKTLSKKDCHRIENYRFEGLWYGNDDAVRIYTFSDKGLVYLKQQLDYRKSRENVKEQGGNATFRDIIYDSYQSVYTGTKPRPFSKLWIEVDDILGDNIEGDVRTVEKSQSASKVVGEECIGPTKNQSCPHSEL